MRASTLSSPLAGGVAALLLAASAAAQDPPTRGGADPSGDAFRFGSPPALPEGMTEEMMWPAATAEEWLRPCLVHWQRSFADAVEVARARRMPLLVAVNMDGEIASEHYAGVRYREPETAAKLEKYVCVIASVYRHTPRDHDPSGARVPCPRFGTVTCGEHVENERVLYERYFDGLRVSPRHIVLDLEGKETQDVYFSWDTAAVLTGFVKGVEGWPEPLDLPEPTLPNLAKSPDVGDREALERRYREGDREARRTILGALATPDAADHVDVLRGAIAGFDPELARLARHALARCETDGSLDVMAEALSVPLESAERELLLEAVQRLAETLPRARTLAALHAGLSLEPRALELPPAGDAAAEYESNAAAGVLARAEAAQARPSEPAAQLALAEALLERALAEERDYSELFFEDARDAAREAQALGASGARLDAVLAIGAAQRRERDEARARAIAAVEAGALAPRAADSAEAPLGAATQRRLLQLFGAARQAQIRTAFRAGEAWDPAWLADVVATYSALARDPAVREETLLESYDFLRWIGATPQAGEVLQQSLLRFPDSPALHERLRERALWEGGPEALERTYVELGVQRFLERGALDWFSGYASLVAAEHLRRRGGFEQALAAYARAAEHYRAHAERNPAGRDDAEHYLALADAGRARVEMERGRLAEAAEASIVGLARRPDSAASPDGLGITPIATARMLIARLREAGDAAAAERVQAALDALDPALLEPPPSEQPRARTARPPERGR